ncbi:MAG: 2-polyprenyl-3-methyl-6-methoxy-1,4-benzoquinone monooxygenase [Alphaproteobacteria bacterium]|nr:2-polyprenyl-3-methyl-6-methoxy-1,4-benzoquinone monooxygenase [Alphaproteobacteria bacterium]
MPQHRPRTLSISLWDPLLTLADSALRTVWASHHAQRPYPGGVEGAPMTAEQKNEAAALMRVNHVGEVCAQALYTAQAQATRNPALRRHFQHACAEETDHLAWTEQRLTELGGRPSLLNPLWYAGALVMGYAAGKLGGDRVSLGFVVETERQVESHLQSHLERLPEQDVASRAIVAQMQADEARHAIDAEKAGATPLPRPVQELMRLLAKVMTTVAHRV